MDYSSLKEITNNWININDCLPYEYEYVILSYVDELDNRLRYLPTIAWLNDDHIWHTREGDVENNNSSFDYFKEHKFHPTHWMKLPAKPD